MSKNNTNVSVGTNVRYDDNVKLIIDTQATRASILQAKACLDESGFFEQ